MPRIENTIDVSVGVDKVWNFLGKLENAPDYIPGIISATVQGSRRICLDQDSNEIHEEISDHSDTTHEFSFEHTQSPLPVKSSKGRFAVDGNDKQSTVSMSWELEFLDPAMEANLLPIIDGASKMTLSNIKQQTEQG